MNEAKKSRAEPGSLDGVNPREGGAVRTWSLNDLVPVLEALQGLRFGSVELFIQDSRLVQLDRREEIRSFKN